MEASEISTDHPQLIGLPKLWTPTFHQTGDDKLEEFSPKMLKTSLTQLNSLRAIEENMKKPPKLDKFFEN